MWMVLGEVICKIVSALAPINDELALADSVCDPVEFHIYALGATLLDGAVDDTGSDGVVGLDGCGGLRVAHFLEAGAKGAGLGTVVEEASQFGFGGGR